MSIYKDMDRFASQILRITFDGPDVPEQLLYELCRVRFVFLSQLTKPYIEKAIWAYHRYHYALNNYRRRTPIGHNNLSTHLFYNHCTECYPRL